MSQYLIPDQACLPSALQGDDKRGNLYIKFLIPFITVNYSRSLVPKLLQLLKHCPMSCVHPALPYWKTQMGKECIVVMQGGFFPEIKWKESFYHCSFSAWQNTFILAYIPKSDQNPAGVSKRNTDWRALDCTSNWYRFKHCANLISLTSNTFANLILYTS